MYVCASLVGINASLTKKMISKSPPSLQLDLKIQSLNINNQLNLNDLHAVLVVNERFQNPSMDCYAKALQDEIFMKWKQEGQHLSSNVIPDSSFS